MLGTMRVPACGQSLLALLALRRTCRTALTLRCHLCRLSAAGAHAMGDCVPAIPPPSFCDMVTYNVTKDIHTPIPDPNNVKDLDDIAKDIYFTAIEVRPCVLRIVSTAVRE